MSTRQRINDAEIEILLRLIPHLGEELAETHAQSIVSALLDAGWRPTYTTADDV